MPDPVAVDSTGPAVRPPVSAVMTVLNEQRHLRAAVGAILAQRYAGELEVVVALGPSTDGTAGLAARLADEDPRVTVVRNPDPHGATPAGLNAAIAAARHDIVVRVDGHAVLPPDYVETAVATLERTGADNVGGIMAAEGETSFERAVARAMTTRLGVGSAPFHTGGEEGPAQSVYLGVFRRAALERAGGYDESFTRAQDWELNLRIRATGGTIWFQPRLRVSYRPRSSARALARQYFHYGRWRRVIVRRHPETASLRYLAPGAAVLGVGGGLVLGLAGRRVALAVPGAYALGVLAGGVVNGRGLGPAAAAQLPGVYATMHMAWGAGFLSSPGRLARPEPDARVDVARVDDARVDDGGGAR